MITIGSFPIYLASILGVGLGAFLIFLYYKKVEERSTLYFGLLSLAEAVHSFGHAMLLNADSFTAGLFWSRILHFGAILLAFFCILFINDFTGHKKKINQFMAYIFLVFLFFLPSNYFLRASTELKPYNPAPYMPDIGPLYAVFGFFVCLAAFYILYMLISYKKRYKGADTYKLLRLNTLFAGMIIIVIAGVYDMWGMINQVKTVYILSYALILLCIMFTIRVFLYHVDMVKWLKKSYFSAIFALINTLEAKDKYTLGHSQRVKKYAEIIARGLDLAPERISLIKMAALLHDIGKIGIPDSVLNKPDKLTDEEWDKIKYHPVKGTQILDPIEYLRGAKKFIFNHHERIDGKGYPAGLKGDEIPLEAQIISIADTFDAITTGRRYRKAISFEEAVDEIIRNRGTQFSDEIVESFLGEKDKLRNALSRILPKNK
ncbi:MAG: HD domain-containing phosphohydrolase [Armatimonadota bacterium]